MGNEITLMLGAGLLWLLLAGFMAMPSTEGAADGWPAEDALLWPLYVLRFGVWLTADAFHFLLRVGSRAWAVVRGR